MGREIFLTKIPSPGFYYSAFFALLLHILVNITQSIWLWGMIQIASLLLLFHLGCIAFCDGENRKYLPLFTLIYFSSIPIYHNLRWGQISTILILLAFLSFYLWEKKKKKLSAFWLALAISIKFYPLLLVPFFIIKKEVKYLFWLAGLAFLFLVFIPMFFLGITETINFYLLLKKSLLELAGTSDPNSQFIGAVFSRLLANINDPGKFFVYQLFKWLGTILYLGNIILVYLFTKRKILKAHWYSFSLLISSTPLIIDTSWPHYFVYLPLCQLFLITLSSQIHSSKYLVYRSLLITLSIILSNIILFTWIGNYVTFSTIGLYLFSSLLITLTCYLDYYFLTARRPTNTPIKVNT